MVISLVANGLMGGKKQRVSETELRLIYLSLIIIVVLAVLMQLDIYSVGALFLIVIVAIANIVYFYNRSRKRAET